MGTREGTRLKLDSLFAFNKRHYCLLEPSGILGAFRKLGLTQAWQLTMNSRCLSAKKHRAGKRQGLLCLCRCPTGQADLLWRGLGRAP